MRWNFPPVDGKARKEIGKLLPEFEPTKLQKCRGFFWCLRACGSSHYRSTNGRLVVWDSPPGAAKNAGSKNGDPRNSPR